MSVEAKKRPGDVDTKLKVDQGFKVLSNSNFGPNDLSDDNRCYLDVMLPDGRVLDYTQGLVGRNEYEAFARAFREAATTFDPKLKDVKLVAAKSKVGNDGKGTYANLTFVRGKEEWVSSVRAPGRYESFCQAYAQGFNHALNNK